jgi:protease-4
MTRKGCIWGWLVGAAALLVVFLVTMVTVETILGQHLSFPTYGARIGLVRVEGAIYDSRPLIEEMRWLAKDAGVKALLLRVDSPGGGAAASQEIHDYIRGLQDEGMPVVVSMGSMAASGGYYIACSADTIVANAGTLTGSIGVIMSFTNLQELFGKIGMDFEVIKSGRYKDTGSWSRQMTEDERALLQGTIDDIHSQFVEAVAEGRGMDFDSVAELADGRIFSGRQALEAGLVDTLGTLEDAVAIAGRMGGIEGTPHVQEPVRRERLTLLDLLTGAASDIVAPEAGHMGAHYIYRPSK